MLYCQILVFSGPQMRLFDFLDFKTEKIHLPFSLAQSLFQRIPLCGQGLGGCQQSLSFKPAWQWLPVR